MGQCNVVMILYILCSILIVNIVYYFVSRLYNAYTVAYTMPTVAEHYKFAEVEQDGKQFMNDFFKQSKVFEVGSMTDETMMKLGDKDVVAKCLLSALKLIERQHNMVINQRVHLSSYQQDIIKLQSSVIDAQEKALRATNYISQAVEQSVQQILGNESVYLTPDRTAEQRVEHRTLVEQLKKKGEDEPARHHYIKGGQIFSTELRTEES